jgi:hypothetical protein
VLYPSLHSWKDNSFPLFELIKAGFALPQIQICFFSHSVWFIVDFGAPWFDEILVLVLQSSRSTLLDTPVRVGCSS